jgi:FkbM family methyltransferase
MKIIKRLLMTLLGEKKYLSLLAFSFQRIYKTGRLGKQYQDIYFLKKIIRPGDYCVDIGAHLGYYTLELSRLVGSEGKIFAIEPMSKFHDTLRHLLKEKGVKNTTLYQLALGGQGEWVEMGIPFIGKMKRHAYARVMEYSTYLEYAESEKVRNETGDVLFRQLPRLDFIKCDVEGLEVQVFSSLMETLKAHRPILLCELADKNERIKLYEMIVELGYQAYLLEKGKLRILDIYSDKKAISHNHYFIYQGRAEEEDLQPLLSDVKARRGRTE